VWRRTLDSCRTQHPDDCSSEDLPNDEINEKVGRRVEHLKDDARLDEEEESAGAGLLLVLGHHLHDARRSVEEEEHEDDDDHDKGDVLLVSLVPAGPSVVRCLAAEERRPTALLGAVGGDEP